MWLLAPCTSRKICLAVFLILWNYFYLRSHLYSLFFTNNITNIHDWVWSVVSDLLKKSRLKAYDVLKNVDQIRSVINSTVCCLAKSRRLLRHIDDFLMFLEYSNHLISIFSFSFYLKTKLLLWQINNTWHAFTKCTLSRQLWRGTLDVENEKHDQ